MDNNINAYRQPMVTATGIILGFMLNFTASWVKTETPLKGIWLYFVAVSLFIGALLLIIVLYRILKLVPSHENTVAYYNNTLLLLIIGISTAFSGMFLDLFFQFLQD